ncbi:MAG: type II toxin-antitoxin system HicA family toxin [Chloroflexota bacterium]
MSKHAKSLARLRQNPNSVRFEEIDKILLDLGYDKRQRGSHAIYTRQGSPPITIPFRKLFILPVYVKQVIRIIDQFNTAGDSDLDV